MPEIVAHIITTKRQHCHWVPSQDPLLMNGRGSGFRAGPGPQEYAVLPIKGLGNQRNQPAPASAQDYRRDRHAFGVIKFLGKRRRIVYRYGKTSIRMRGF